MLAALFHDLGQYPLAHDLEEADYQFFSHEEFGGEILKRTESLREILSKPESENGWAVDPERIKAILSANPGTMVGTLKDRILHSLIDGPFDADKIDYIRRDSRNLGVPYGLIIDFEQLLRCLTIIYREQKGQTYSVLGLHEKGKVVAEAIGFARYAMFGQVYWHHTNRALKAMVHRMVWETVGIVNDSRAQLRDSFRSLLVPSHEEGDQQMLWFVNKGAGRAEDPAATCQIDASDLSVLRWLAERGGENGKVLLDLLISRRIFKRIFVLSKETPMRHLWDEASRFFRDYRRDWKAKRTLQVLLQKKLWDFVNAPPELPPQSQFITPDAKNKFLAEASVDPDPNVRPKVIILIDIPLDKKPSDSGLEYLVEEDRRKLKVEELHTESLERSIVWGALHNSFVESIGKLRILAHPDHADFLASFVPPNRFEEALSASLKDAETEIEKNRKSS